MSKVDLIHHKWSPFPNREGRRKGFTIAELVVAMAIIFIVSATAIGIINTQNTVHLRTTQTVEATNMAENAIECFRYANSVEGFEEVYGKTFKESTIVFTETKVKENETTTWTFEKNGMTVTIEIITKIEGGETVLNELKFNAIAKDNDKVILKESYTK